MDPPPGKGKDSKPAKETPKPAADEPIKPAKPPGQIDLVIGKDGLPQGLSETPRTELESTSPDAKQPPTSLFSSSLISQSPDEDKESVMIFPEWEIVAEVPNSSTGAKEVLGGLNGRKNELKSWTLPYRAVVLLCSHKKRDKRCHIAAPLLEKVSPRLPGLHPCSDPIDLIYSLARYPPRRSYMNSSRTTSRSIPGETL